MCGRSWVCLGLASPGDAVSCFSWVARCCGTVHPLALGRDNVGLLQCRAGQEAPRFSPGMGKAQGEGLVTPESPSGPFPAGRKANRTRRRASRSGDLGRGHAEMYFQPSVS